MEVDLLEKAGVHSASAELSGPLYVGVYLNVSFFKSRFGRKMELESGKGISGQYALLVPPEESWGRGPELPLRARALPQLPLQGVVPVRAPVFRRDGLSQCKFWL